jgi:methyl-accepting chemotaxis protein
LVRIDARLKTLATAADRTLARAENAISMVVSGRPMPRTRSKRWSASETAPSIDDVIEGLDNIAFQTRVLASIARIARVIRLQGETP